MAVLRASLLWVTMVNPGRTVTPMTGHRDPRYVVSRVLTVPAGKKAIIRGMTHVLSNIPGAAESPAFWVRMGVGTNLPIAIRRFWWRTYDGNQYTFRDEDSWTGMVVVPANWWIEVINACTVGLETQGSGMLVDA